MAAGVCDSGSFNGRTFVAIKSAQVRIKALRIATDHRHSGVDTENLAENTDANRPGELTPTSRHHRTTKYAD